MPSAKARSLSLAFSPKAADPADEIIRRKEGQIIDTDDGGGQGGRRDARIERERDGKDVSEPDAVEEMKGDEPAHRNLPSRTGRHDRAGGERKEPGHRDDAADAELGDLRRLRKFFRPESPEHDRARETTDGQDGIERDQPGRRHFLSEEDEVGGFLGPDEVGVEDLLIADDREREHRQKREQRDDSHFFAMSERCFRGTFVFLDNGGIGRKIFSAEEINGQADQHADARGAEAPMPAINFAERAGDERRGNDTAVDEQVVNLESIGAPVVAGWYKAPTWLARLPLKQPTPVSRQVSARRNVRSKAIKKCPADMSSAPIVIVRVRPSTRSAINPPTIGVR